jgi:hypothetical protein
MSDKVPLGPPPHQAPTAPYPTPHQRPTERPAPTRSDPPPDTRKGPGR